MKKSKILFFFFILFYLSLYSIEINEINFYIKKLNEYKRTIVIKEKQLNNLRLKNYSSWNFLERKNNETIIQNKNKLIREINFLYDEIKRTEDKLLEIRIEILNELDNKIKNDDFFSILNYMDDIQYNKLINFAYNDLMMKSNTKELDEINIRILYNYKNDVKSLIRYFKLKLELIKKHSIKYNENLIKEQIEALDKIYKQLNF